MGYELKKWVCFSRQWTCKKFSFQNKRLQVHQDSFWKKKLKADQLNIYTTQLRSWTWDYWEQIQTVLGCKDLKQGPPGFKSSILKQLATSHSRKCVFVSFPRNWNKNVSLNIKCRTFVSGKPWLCWSIAKGYRFHTHDESENCMHKLIIQTICAKIAEHLLFKG